MKNLLLILLIILPISLTAQLNDAVQIDYYLKKSISKKKTANVLLFTGGGLLLTGVIVASTAEENGGFFIPETHLAGLGIATLGVLSSLTSIPFYISASHHKNKSLKIFPAISHFQSDSLDPTKQYGMIGVKVNF